MRKKNKHNFSYFITPSQNIISPIRPANRATSGRLQVEGELKVNPCPIVGPPGLVAIAAAGWWGWRSVCMIQSVTSVSHALKLYWPSFSGDHAGGVR